MGTPGRRSEDGIYAHGKTKKGNGSRTRSGSTGKTSGFIKRRCWCPGGGAEPAGCEQLESFSSERHGQTPGRRSEDGIYAHGKTKKGNGSGTKSGSTGKTCGFIKRRCWCPGGGAEPAGC